MRQTKPTYPTMGAELVFEESPHGGSWTGRLLTLRGVVDTQRRLQPLTKQPKRCRITQGDGYFLLERQVDHPSGRRVTPHHTLRDAQAFARKWAARRFRVRVSQ